MGGTRVPRSKVITGVYLKSSVEDSVSGMFVLLLLSHRVMNGRRLNSVTHDSDPLSSVFSHTHF